MKKWSAAIVLSCAQFIMVLDSTVMNVSISTVVKDLHTTVSALQSAIALYALTMAALMLTGGKLGDKWGKVKAFRIGAVVYAIGSLITALSVNVAMLFAGWSVIEGLGAVLVIPAIAALVAVKYSGRDRVIGFTAIGAASGIAVAAGPLIGGYITTYSSWRYVFAAETVVMGIILLVSKILAEKNAKTSNVPLDISSVILSASGMVLLVLGILQSKTWGWLIPKAKPVIAGHAIAPLGISLSAYLIVFGLIVLKAFYDRQRKLEKKKANPLLQVSMLSIKTLRSGLAVLSSQYLITAAIFFMIPIYLQMVLGLDALQTGKKIFPLSVAIVIFSVIGSRLINRFSPKRIVRLGQLALVGGCLLILGSINPQLKGVMFGLGMVVVGAGLGLLVSQIGNVTMSSVSEDKTNEVGGLQGTFQNLGSALGTAIIGSIIIASLTTSFTNNINQNTELSSAAKTQIFSQTKNGVPITSVSQVQQAGQNNGLTTSESESLANSYGASEVTSLKIAMFFIATIGLLSIYLSRNLPAKKLI